MAREEVQTTFVKATHSQKAICIRPSVSALIHSAAEAPLLLEESKAYENSLPGLIAHQKQNKIGQLQYNYSTYHVRHVEIRAILKHARNRSN